MDKENTDKGVKLARACMNGKLETVKVLVKEGIRADIKYRGWKIPIKLAVEESHLDVIQYLISSDGGGYDIDTIIGSKGETMLTIACKRDNVKIVEFLLHQGANMDVICITSEYIENSTSNSTEIAKLLLNHGLRFDKLVGSCYFTDEVWQELEDYADEVSKMNIKPAKTKS